MKIKLTACALSLLATSVAIAEEKPNTEMNIEEIQKEIVKPVLTVNGNTLTIGHLIAYRDTRQGISLPEDPVEAQDLLVNEMVSNILLSQEAEKMGLDKNPQVVAGLEVARLQTLRQAALNLLLSQQQISDDAVKKYYDQNFSASESNEFKASHILVKTEEEAKGLIKSLDGGADFAELAKEKSTGPSGKNGGDLGWFSLDRMVKPFSDAVGAMEKGKYSAAPVQTDFGWHVIKLEDTRNNKVTPPEFDSVKDQIISELKIDAVRKHMQTLQENAKIEIPEGSAIQAIEK